MSVLSEAVRHVSDVRSRLRNPPNAVADRPIDLKRIPMQPIVIQETPKPKPPSVDDMAFGPIVSGPFVEPRITVPKIQRIVQEHYKISRVELLGPIRTAPLVHARRVGMFLCRRLTTCSLPALGRMFGDRDHTTVLAGVRAMDAKYANDPAFRAEIDDLIAILSD